MSSYQVMIRQKICLAFWLMLIFFPVYCYIHLSGKQGSGGAQLLVIVASFFTNWMLVLGWLYVGEWALNRVRRQVKTDFLGTGKMWPHVLAISIFLSLNFLATLAFYTAINWLFDDLLRRAVQPDNIAYFTRATYGQLFTMAVCGYILLVNYLINNKIEDDEVRIKQLEKEMLISQFSALENQVNPHFLFNNLSILSSLVRKNADMSEQYIDRLSKAYRYILEQRDHEIVPLNLEMEFLQSYIFLLEIRFEHKFEVRINLTADESRRFLIAPLTLQILVENAVKHNRMSLKEPLLIYINLEKQDILTVRNNIQPRGQAVKSTSVGLQNIINRYRLITHRSVWAGEAERIFEVRIPLLTTAEMYV